jgi:hypothetical protein
MERQLNQVAPGKASLLQSLSEEGAFACRPELAGSSGAME